MGRLLLVARLAGRDLRRRRAEAVLLLLAFTAAMTTLTLGLLLNGVTDRPYQQTRTTTSGPDIVAASYPASATSADGSRAALAALAGLTREPQVAAHSGPFPVTWVSMGASGHAAAALVEGRDPGRAAVDQPKVTRGAWITDAGTAVVERGFADAVGITTGDVITLSGRPFRVSGIAVTAAVPSYPQTCTDGCEPDTTRAQGDETGLVWVTRSAAASLATSAHPLYYLLNLRLSNPDGAQAFAMSHAAVSGQTGPFMNSWENIGAQDAKVVAVERQDLLIGSWLLGLLAVASVAVLVGGRMADQTRRVGLLKAVGGSPALLATVLLAEYVFVALLAAVAGLATGRLAAPLLTDPGSGLVGSAQAPAVTAAVIVPVVIAAVAVAVVATFVPALRAARIPTVRALSNAARPPKRRGALIALSARLPVTLLIGLRLAARRPGRTLLSAVSVGVTTSGIVAVLTSRAHLMAQSTGRLDNPQTDLLSQVLLTVSVMMVALTAVNAVFITWATVLDARRASALTRALGATPRQVSAGLSVAQAVPALLGAVFGVPCGIGLIAVARHGGPMTYPPVWAAVLLVLATAPFVIGLTALPARLEARRPIGEVLES